MVSILKQKVRGMIGRLGITENNRSRSNTMELNTVDETGVDLTQTTDPISTECYVPPSPVLPRAPPITDIEEQNPSNEASGSEPWVLTGPKQDKLLDLSSNTITPEKITHEIDEKVRRNPQSVDVKLIQTKMEYFINYLLGGLKENDEKWDYELIKCGSYYEGLRVGLPYELDFMLVLKYFRAVEIVTACNAKSSNASILDNMEVKFVTTRTNPAAATLNTLYPLAQLEYVEFRRNMIPCVRHVLQRRNTFQGLKLLEVGDHNNAPNMCLYFEYEGRKIYFILLCIFYFFILIFLFYLQK